MRSSLDFTTVASLMWALMAAPTAMATDFREPFAGLDSLTAEGLVEIVTTRNPSLAELRAAAEEAASRIEPAGSLEDPQLSYALAPQTIGGFTTPGGLEREVNQRIELSQAIPWPGTLALRESAARSEAEAANQSLAEQRLQIVAVIKSGFAEWYYVHRALEINEHNQTLLIELRNVAEAQYAAGRATQQDVLQAEVAHARLQDQALGLERSRRSIQAQLNGLVDRAPNKSLPPPAKLEAPTPPPGFEALQQAAIQSHPELLKLQARLAAQQAEVGLAEKDFLPDFRLMAAYNSFWDAEEKRFLLGGSINIPLDRSKYRALLDAAQAGSMKVRWRLADRRAQLLTALEQARAEVAESVEVIELYEERLVPLAEENLHAAESDYRAGAGDFLNVIDAENQKLATELRLQRARGNYVRRVADLERWSGGKLPSPSEGR